MWFNATMEDTTRERIAGKTPEVRGVDEMPRWIEAIDRHALTGKPVHFYISNDKAFTEFTKLIGHDSVKSEQIVAYYYSALAFERYEADGKSMNFKGDMSVLRIQEMIGDTGSMLEHPNDYRVNLAIALDAETMVLYGHQMSSEPNVCSNCQHSTDPDIIEGLELNEGRHGCGHAEDSYDSQNSAVMMKRIDSSKALDQLFHLF